MRVICTLKNASHSINGVAFAPYDRGGMISEDIPEETASQFLTIKGYSALCTEVEPEPVETVLEPEVVAVETAPEVDVEATPVADTATVTSKKKKA